MTDTSRDALIKELRIKSSMMQMGEYIGWGSDTALMIQAADMLEANGKAQQAAVPMTPEQAQQVLGLLMLPGLAVMRDLRRIEAHHGIGAKP